MNEKIKLIIIMVLVIISAVSLFIGQRTYSAKKAIELERNALINENQGLARKLEEIARERKQLQERVNVLSNDLDKFAKEKQDIQNQYELIVKEKEGLVEKLKALQRNNEQLRADLNNLSREKQKLGQNLEDNLASLRNDNLQLKEQLDNLNTLKGKLEAELGQLKGDKSDLERKLNEIDSFLEQKLTGPKYASLKEEIGVMRSGGQIVTETETQTAQPENNSVELPPIVVKPQTQAQGEKSTSTWPKKGITVKPAGRVLEINRENKFVIIDLGLEVGTKIGDTLKVYKQGVPIATIEVVQVRQVISACDIKEEITDIEAGDIVR